MFCYCSYYYDGVGYMAINQSINQLILIMAIDILPIYKRTSWTTSVYDILRYPSSLYWAAIS